MIGLAITVAALVAGAPPSRPLPSPARAVELRVEHLVNPLGIDAIRPRFSWQMADARQGARQSAYRLLVATTPGRLIPGRADVWDSGVVEADSSLDVTYAGPPLAWRHRYYWTVCLRDGAGHAAPCARAAWWETGMMGERWRAAWIAASDAPLDTIASIGTDGQADSGTVPLLRRAFAVEAAPVRARIYATALGSYRLTVNGRPAGPGVLVPDWTDYRDRVTYQTYDVTRLLRPGRNAMGVLLGAGWFASRMGFSSKRYAYGPPPVRLLLELVLTWADGREEVIGSDTSWRAASSPVLSSEIYDGETYDARLEQPGWDGPGFDDRGWHHVLVEPAPAAALQAQAMPDHRANRHGPRAAAVVARRRHLGLRPRPELRRLGAPRGEGSARHRRPDAVRRDPRRRRPQHHAGQSPQRQGHRHVRPERPRRGDVRAALHLSRVPLRRGDGLSRAGRLSAP